MSVGEQWRRNADAWERWARTPGHDHNFAWQLPRFLALLPLPPRRTLDVGCGEGRVGAELVARGYDVVGVDSSPRMVELASERHEAVHADAAALPFADASFDLVVAFMSLFNMDDIDGAITEASRVLRPGGCVCAAVLHPLALVMRGDTTVSYFDDSVVAYRVVRDDVEVTFHDRQVSLERYSRALAAAGLAIDALREIPHQEKPLPLFLHLRAVKR
jgi:ubiquinone/menaquinone biosynthesis C-methylase UbiE